MLYCIYMKPKNIISLVVAVVIPVVVGALSGVATQSGVTTWYLTLAKPELNPPSWIFAPVWTTLFVLMGVASWLVWRSFKQGKRSALVVYGIQLALNALWSLLFFGLHSPGAALIEIAVLWIAIAVAGILFWRISKPAAVLLIPYLAWVSFASYLNYMIWVLN